MAKKGSMFDLIWIAVSLIIIALVSLIMFKISDSFNVKIQASADFEDKGKATMQQMNNMYPGIIDNSFLVLAIGVAIMAFIMAAMVRIHPIFIFIFIFFLAIVIVLGGVFSVVYTSMASEPEFIDVANQLIFTSTILKSLPFIVGIFGSFLAIIMYKTWQGVQYE